MSRGPESEARSKEAFPQPANDAALDEACFLAELRLSVEGARTPAEEALAQRHPEWSDRLTAACARFGH